MPVERSVEQTNSRSRLNTTARIVAVAGSLGGATVAEATEQPALLVASAVIAGVVARPWVVELGAQYRPKVINWVRELRGLEPREESGFRTKNLPNLTQFIGKSFHERRESRRK